MVGYVKLHRKFTQWEWYNDLSTRAVFIHLLLKANYKPSRFMGNDVPIGGLVIGITSLSDAVGLSIQQTRTALKKLKSTNEINIKATNKFSICTIVKWADYQGGQHSDNIQITNEQQTSNKRATTSKEGKKGRREEDIKTKQKKDKPFLHSDLPSNVDHEKWDALMDIRKQKKAVNSRQALVTISNKLKSMGDLANTALDNAIESSWKTVYPPKNATAQQSQGKTAAQIATENFKKRNGLL